MKTAHSQTRMSGDFESILDFVNNCFEGFRMIHTEVSEDLTVDVDAVGMEQTHELGIAETLKTGSCVNTLNPECAELTLLQFAAYISIGKTFFVGVFGNGPHVLTGTEVTSGQTQNFLSLSS